MTAKEFLKERRKLRRQLAATHEKINALDIDFPGEGNLREAEPKDIRVGRVIWQLDCDIGVPMWQIIEEIRDPRDDFKAFVAEDGCRYGLHDCWVEAGK